MSRHGIGRIRVNSINDSYGAYNHVLRCAYLLLSSQKYCNRTFDQCFNNHVKYVIAVQIAQAYLSGAVLQQNIERSLSYFLVQSINDPHEGQPVSAIRLRESCS